MRRLDAVAPMALWRMPAYGLAIARLRRMFILEPFVRLMLVTVVRLVGHAGETSTTLIYERHVKQRVRDISIASQPLIVMVIWGILIAQVLVAIA